ncbi:hypothetical protein RFI_27666 [Reticulomyxa filosa]|uniref:Uncharacterized protein n=1 Tax=Reticulomyxa filosa TaxID=46433 RepID=X6M703_RETFI|nr:hypothetical protein RFI_27666 [Reticulomyxa filosa]|eukprot:ETO09709.1 hypothetical protein RFI_27666 [Reticulomyxa filosa]
MTSLDAEESKREKKRTLVLWDFDWSLINENSDYYPFHKLLGDKFKEKNKEWAAFRKKNSGMSFVEFQDQIAWKYLFEEPSVTKEAFVQVLHNIPIFPENVHIIRTLHNFSSNKFINKKKKKNPYVHPYI